MKYQQLVIGLLAGMVIGYLVANSFGNRYALYGIGDNVPYRLDQKTGDVWFFPTFGNTNMVWIKTQFPPAD